VGALVGQDGAMAALVALGPILVIVGIGIGIFAIGEDSAGMVLTGFVIASVGMVLTIVAFIALRIQAANRNQGDTGPPTS
jgi:multisubunit Na+/H+ antiporter MnhB subunit